MPAPTLTEVLTYLGPVTWSDDDVQAALDAETTAQARRCRVPADMPADMREALCRRVARNLAARSNPLVTSSTSADGLVSTTSRVPLTDPEIRRLEGPWRRTAVG